MTWGSAPSFLICPLLQLRLYNFLLTLSDECILGITLFSSDITPNQLAGHFSRKKKRNTHGGGFLAWNGPVVRSRAAQRGTMVTFVGTALLTQLTRQQKLTQFAPPRTLGRFVADDIRAKKGGGSFMELAVAPSESEFFRPSSRWLNYWKWCSPLFYLPLLALLDENALI